MLQGALAKLEVSVTALYDSHLTGDFLRGELQHIRFAAHQVPFPTRRDGTSNCKPLCGCACGWAMSCRPFDKELFS